MVYNETTSLKEIFMRKIVMIVAVVLIACATLLGWITVLPDVVGFIKDAVTLIHE